MYNAIEGFIFIGILLILVPLLGSYMAKTFVYMPDMAPYRLESAIYQWSGIDYKKEMTWKNYAKALISFNVIGFLFLFLFEIFQGWLPLNPQNFKGLQFDLALNTAISFTTNTNWQAYGGETTMSYLTQVVGLTVQNFLSAATGNAVLVAFIRGILRKNCDVIGNFWVDLTRTLIYLLLPLSILFALFLVGQGVIQNFNPYIETTTLMGDSQIIPMGPVASQVAIKQLGTNGGGFFNANSAHPFENPTPLSNFFETLAILLIPASAIYMYGVLINSKKQCYVIFSVMAILFALFFGTALISENHINPALQENPVLEGQETRFGRSSSILWAIATTSTSNGSVNSMLSSLSPIAGGISMLNMMLGEVIFGGVGVGLCGILMFILLTVFLAGLMVGRTPEYLGKKIEKKEIQWVMVAVLFPCALILIGSAIATVLPNSLASLENSGPHGLSEILYAFSSSAANNGSAFAGLNANTPFYNIILGFVMFLGRCAIVFPSLALAGSLASKKTVAPSVGTFATDTFLFGVMLFSIIIIVAALTFFPALSLGPVIEQMLMLKGKTF